MRHWNSVERNEIASLLRRGLTAGQIALRYEGRTRSSIIGFVHRDPDLKAIGFQHDKIFPKRNKGTFDGDKSCETTGETGKPWQAEIRRAS